ncbi:class I SAM-dependent methyltransferase [Paenibacillus marchantiae]|uniref:class I SAM-dependent methyltransferase n=1 Tax=Paenibacillus marchantiae TaxID=3026433 RepID=UPI003084425D
MTHSTTQTLSLLDCSCGIGTQAIGLAKYGYNVSATDVSPDSVKRAEKEAASRGVNINFGVADFRSLDTDLTGVFDIVLSADNAIPHHLQTEIYIRPFKIYIQSLIGMACSLLL